MSEGLTIDTHQFQRLPQKQQLSILYENTEELKMMILGYKFQQKVQWIAIIGLAVVVGAGKYLGLI